MTRQTHLRTALDLGGGAAGGFLAARLLRVPRDDGLPRAPLGGVGLRKARICARRLPPQLRRRTVLLCHLYERVRTPVHVRGRTAEHLSMCGVELNCMIEVQDRS
jgi:hypothetical protein